ncbi:MAG: SDR family oxidoreductase [Bacteroidota bacterium]
MELKGKRIIILGGTSGIGLATAQALAKQEANVVIVSGNKQRVEAALVHLPKGTEGHTVDLSKEEAIKAFFGKIGNFDHLVYTAGENLKLGTIDSIDLQEARDFFNIRYWGAFAAVKYGSPHINTGGSIILTSGIAAVRPNKGWSLGSSICSAMEGFCKAIAVELAPIRVNIVSPGVVETNLWNNIPEEDRKGLYTHMTSTLPVKFVGQAEDLAKTYVYLMTQNYATGQTVIVDGGNVLV